jgi:hypothetical protein
MAKLKRSGARVTFSVSVSVETKAILQRAADARFAGNVSALVEAIALEADRQAALDTMLDRMPTPSESEFESFMQELEDARSAGAVRAGSPAKRTVTRTRAKKSIRRVA